MSSRNMRKLLGGNVLPANPDDDSDYEPLSYQQIVNKFEALVSSSSESHEEGGIKDEESPEEDTTPPECEKKTSRNNRKKRQKKRGQKRSMDISMDEIDKTVRELSATLGCPSTSSAFEEPETASVNLFAIKNKYLNHEYELKRKFGPDNESSASNRRRGRRPDMERITKRGLIVSNIDKFHNLPKVGLTMSIDRRENNIVYFTINHNDEEYRKMHKQYIVNAWLAWTQNVLRDIDINDSLRSMHVEEMVEAVDLLFRLEDYTQARNVLEQVIAYLQYISHPSFRLSDPNIRLEYAIRENRVFHVAILKYLHILSNTACHRTALELAKLLMNLDPSDPLAMVFMIDTLALRAREHQWLVDVFEVWKTKKHAEYLFNLLYSTSMAKFHIAKKSNGSYVEADMDLQRAILRFPYVVLKILQATNTKNAAIQSHVFYKICKQRTPKNFRSATYIYAKFSGSKWREPEVLAWFIRNALHVANMYDTDEGIKSARAQWNEQSVRLFQDIPNEVTRHLGVIRPMGNLLLDEDLHKFVPRSIYSIDPMPMPETVNRYNYQLTPTTPREVRESMLAGFFLTMSPEYTPQRPRPNQNDGGQDEDDNDDNAGNLFMFIQNTFRHLLAENRTAVFEMMEQDSDSEWDLVLG